MEERRRSPRTRTLRGAKILFNDKRCVIDCIVRNISPEGACLQVESQAGIPKLFDLMIEGETVARACELRWQSTQRMGVSCTAALRADDTERMTESAPPRTDSAKISLRRGGR